MSDHALLSPSGASRWIACTPSARMEQQFPDKNSEEAQEGTLAHKLAELLISFKLNLLKKAEYNKKLTVIIKDNLYEPVMFDYIDEYASYVIEKFNEAKNKYGSAFIVLEKRLDLTKYVPEGFGTSDVTIVAGSFMHVIDLKYGKGVPVSAVKNKQAMLYGLGAFDAYDCAFDITNIRLTIYQPRLDSITDYDITAKELLEWANEELIPRAKLAFEGKGEFVPGDHCRFCRAKPVCRAYAEYNLELEFLSYLEPDQLTDDEIISVLQKGDSLKAWITEVEKYILDKALGGKKWKGYKLVEGRSNRVYSDPEKVAKRLLNIGYTADMIYELKLLGITAMEKLLTKTVFNAELEGLIIKPSGKPTLAPENDPRAEYSKAAIDFSNI